MRLRLLLAVAVLACASGVAAAKPIGAAEAKKTFFGLDMSGVFEPDGSQWRECVDAKGETQYWHNGSLERGRLRINDSGELCFAYEKSGYRDWGCYTAERKGQGWRFVNAKDPGGVFIATRATPTSVCRGDAPNA